MRKRSASLPTTMAFSLFVNALFIRKPLSFMYIIIHCRCYRHFQLTPSVYTTKYNYITYYLTIIISRYIWDYRLSSSCYLKSPKHKRLLTLGIRDSFKFKAVVKQFFLQQFLTILQEQNCFNPTSRT